MSQKCTKNVPKVSEKSPTSVPKVCLGWVGFAGLGWMELGWAVLVEVES